MYLRLQRVMEINLLNPTGVHKKDDHNFNDIDNSICDFFIICSGRSSTHVKAIEENVRKKVHKKTKQKPWHTEQDNKADWILMDYCDIILHIFQEETRNYYNLEELWGDAKKISYN